VVIEHFLNEACAVSAADDHASSRRVFQARPYAELLAEIPTLVGPRAIREAMSSGGALRALRHPGRAADRLSPGCQ
jgi:hypothetical protein